MTSTIDSPDTRVLHHWVGGKPLEGVSGRFSDVTDPATGAVTGYLPLASEEETAVAVAAAAAAFPAWRDTSLTRRTQILFRFRELLNERAPELAALITAEHGKVLSDAAGEVARGQEVVEFACGMPHLLKGSATENASTGVDVHSVRQPLGVVGIISPFNFPAMVPMWFFPVAIAAGNTVVLKPSEKVPSAALWIAELWSEAGLPDGVFNVVNGDKTAVDALLTSPDVKAISFVGSTPIARYIYETGTAHGKRVQALGGAKNHMVVLPDADLDLAADQAVNAGYGSAGERCMAISALVTVGDIADTLVAKIAERTRVLRTGDGRRSSDMGPLVTRAAQERVTGYVDAGEAAGATVVIDGRTGGFDADGDGFFVGPTLLDNVTTEMSVYTDEIFGPVLSVLRVGTYPEAVELINSNPYGNGTALFTQNGAAARRFQNEVEVGMIGINVPVPVPMAYYSFGGWKNSLFGDTHAHGTEGVHFYTRAKVVTTRWPHTATGVDLGFPTNS
ncbi:MULTISPECIES: CoA-acylating methylmalonate-semialdehyde dehydrogenase [Pseudonocardia]|uniref:methylmalonate-semialdehyde dehydrogenase (CoA acylating) n=2 Tax=Pseudonocardia TaxID=1847 RepID=A0A1Y2MUB1_PSEAH|nr:MULTISPECIES: CoA-acylating methylmalonate-semialdehyde dehydrogenase [Pseudonocardia]OSY38377.1 Methylmalonate semialdehyde dehydrogenase [acylating] [Pseudonocardia autotrophica]TDN72579.1 malonate-semialdehyde dehydrogenase (acetylating)/methylmalonate-semialdehyde dehydrogenase [Pseudonocardia autotrophica]BBG03287.1 methylmalonate-semialdehyde dehydrogenase (acylating) [Pseudonocardia autotrophica]GEC24545.1 methylmalonate-semialdehyde dehydrogenase (acylating) [Pseudonocardia saturnea]